MKTNQVLSRPMGQFTVNQRTSDGMFNATELLKQWNFYTENQYIRKDGKSHLKKKEIGDFFRLNQTNDFIRAIEQKENLNTRNSVYLKSRGKNGGTWMHPLLFIDFAMWINAEFKYDVLKFVYDQLIQYRHEAGDSYSLMTSALSKIVRKDFLTAAIKNVARANNYVIYNHHEKNLRNKKAEENSMRELCELQKKVSELIEDGFITEYDALMKYLQTQWLKRWRPKILSTANQ